MLSKILVHQITIYVETIESGDALCIRETFFRKAILELYALGMDTVLSTQLLGNSITRKYTV